MLFTWIYFLPIDALAKEDNSSLFGVTWAGALNAQEPYGGLSFFGAMYLKLVFNDFWCLRPKLHLKCNF